MTDPRLRRQVLLTDDGLLETFWAFLRERLEVRLAPTCDIHYLDVRKASLEDADWPEYDAVALFGGELTEEMLDRAGNLVVVGSETDNLGIAAFGSLWERGIPFIEGTPGWGQSVAECGFALILSALRRIPQWHMQVALGFTPWEFPYVQFCDDPRFVNGTLAGKTVGIVGVGEVGGRIASWCTALGARSIAFDPYRTPARFAEVGADQADLDDLIAQAEVLVVAVPNSPSSIGIIDRSRIRALRQGAVVVTITRAAAVDAAALRERVLADELAWAADVYDTEPLPAHDPLLGRHNVVHLPHIAGRTKDANLAVADIIADDFCRVFAEEQPQYAMTPERLRVRAGLADNPASDRR